MPQLQYSEDWGAEAFQRITETMEALRSYASAMESGDDETLASIPTPEVPSGFPYCGCETCDDRELIYLTMKLALEGHAAGLLELVDAD